MPDYEPDKQELASRDVVSRRMKEHMLKGKGVQSPYGEHLWMDLRHLGKEHLTTKLREVVDICMYFIGVNPITELIPVRPTQHYSMGGIRVNKDGHAYNLEGLFALGEVACWDMHGFNRLGGNSLAETVVGGMVVGKKVAEYTKKATLIADKTLAEQFAKKEQDKMAKMLNNANGENVYKLRDEISAILIKDVHIFRTEEGLTRATEGLLDIIKRTKNIKVHSKAPGMNPELSSALRIEGMAKQAYIIAKGALDRTESRGAHSREDYPKRDDDKWLNRTLARWPEPDGEPVFTYEPVGLLDLPPGYRGYGDDLRVDMKISIEKYNKKMIIDSKVSLTDYERLVNAEDEEKDSFLKAHVNSIRKHVDQLSDKNYQDLYDIESPDFVLMFIPIEPAFAVAVTEDNSIYNKAFEKNIVIVTPSTLLATLRTIDSMWNNEKQQRNAIEIARQAGALYDKFEGLVNDLTGVGKKIDAAN